MNFQEVDQAITEAKDTLNKGDYMIRVLIGMVAGRLRTVGIGYDILCSLKRELSNYNMKTGEWK